MHDRMQAQNRDHEIQILFSAINALEMRISVLERDLGVTDAGKGTPEKDATEAAEPIATPEKTPGE